MPTKPNVSDLTFAITDKTIASLGGPGYVEVRSYDPEKQQANVRYCTKQVRQVDGALVYTDVKIEYDVPVSFPAGGGRSMTWGLEPGDVATGIVRKASHDEVDAGSAIPSEPASTRQFSTSDLVVQPGAGRPGAPLPSSAWRSDGQMVLGLPNGEALFVGTSTATLRLVIEDVLKPYLDALKAWADAHTHTVAGVTTGPGSVTSNPPSGSSPSVPVTADLASGRIKVDT